MGKKAGAAGSSLRSVWLSIDVEVGVRRKERDQERVENGGAK